jgi:hypothetical protein
MRLTPAGAQKSAGCGVPVTSITRIAAMRDHLGRGRRSAGAGTLPPLAALSRFFN